MKENNDRYKKKIIIPLTDKEISEIVPEKYISEVKDELKDSVVHEFLDFKDKDKAVKQVKIWWQIKEGEIQGKTVLKIFRDCWCYPIFYDVPDFIESDPIVKEITEKIMDLNGSYYEFDSHDQACWFNYEQEFKDRFIWLDLFKRLMARLNEINDGTCVFVDYETEEWEKLCRENKEI